jgi:diguanylate cyclase (GGDEF)-like protein
MTSVLTTLRLFAAHDPAARDQATLINTRRILYAALVCILINIIHIAYFLLAVTSRSDAEEVWRNHIVLSHAVLACGMAAIAIASWRFKAADHAGKAHRLIQGCAIALILTAGVSITTSDQLVTPAITPFLIGCVLVAALFIQPPLAALTGYLLALLALWFLLGVFQQDTTVLLSNRVNAISTVGMAFCLSTFAWTAFNKQLRQQAFIELQQAELGRKNATLAALAASDPLTGLLNRRSFKRLFEHELARMRRQGHAGSLLITDLDHFKRINDEHGHPVGDQVLKKVASVLKENIRQADLLVRWGGEEFLILLPECEIDEAMESAENLRRRSAGLAFATATGEATLTASCGIAALQPEQVDAFARSYRSADQALYASKQSGRNCTKAALTE